MHNTTNLSANREMFVTEIEERVYKNTLMQVLEKHISQFHCPFPQTAALSPKDIYPIAMGYGPFHVIDREN